MKNLLKYTALAVMTISLSHTPVHAAYPKSLPLPETANQAAGTKTPDNATLSSSDQRFIKESALTNLLEIKLGQLAQQRAQSTDVKSFADRMIKDHNDAQHSLETVAQSAGMVLPTDLDSAGKKEFNKLSKLNGAFFDLAYMAFNVPAHAKTLANMKREERSIKNTQLKDWDNKTVPTVEEHLSLAKRTDKELATAGGKTKAAGGSSHY